MAIRIVFTNQGGGWFFIELVMAAAELGSVSYYGPSPVPLAGNVKWIKGPPYSNTNGIQRLLSWFKYLAQAGSKAWGEPGSPLLFIVTNPPLAPVLGWLAKKLKRQRYILLFYDIYPEALVRFAGLSERSLIVRAWRYMNQQAIRHADGVITISAQMAEILRQYDRDRSLAPRLHIVPTWVDTEHIHPMPKQENWFAQRYGQAGKLTLLYSGNLGTVHDLTMVPEIARRLRAYTDLHFVIIGEGAGSRSLADECARFGLDNITFLPLQDDTTLPFSLATADIAIVSLAKGAEGISMPSKTYYMMAAGAALLGFSSATSDLARIIQEHACGVNVVPGDVDGAVQAILALRDQPAMLRQYRVQARQAAETHYSRRVCVPQMLEIIRQLNLST